MRPVALLALALPLVLPALAQTPTPLPPLTRSVEVNVTNVDVIVTDRKGQRVTDLTRDDFVITEDGVAQAITNFYAAQESKAVLDLPVEAMPEGAAPAVQAPKARIAIFVDNLHLTNANRAQVLRAVGDYVASALGPNVEASVATWDRKLLPRGPFTSDGAALKAVLARLESEPAVGEHSLMLRDQVIRQVDQAIRLPPRDKMRDTLIRSSIQSARSYATEAASLLENTTAALGVTIDQLSGIDGRKVLIYVSERVPQVPGADIFQYVRDAVGFDTAYAREVPTDGEFDRATRFHDVVKKAHAAGVAIYSFEARGLTFDTGLSASRPSSQFRIDPAREEANNVGMLQLMAQETGGAAIFSRNSFQDALEEMGRDFSTFYSLGYQSSAPAVGKPRRIKVTVNRPGLSVRTRTGHVEKGPEARVADAVISRLWFPKIQNPLHARLDTGQATKKGKANVVPLRFLVPFEKLTLVPEGDRLRGRLVFQVAAMDEGGRLSPVRSQTAPIEVPTSAEAEIKGKDFTFETELELRSSGQLVSVALTDETSRQTSYVQFPLSPTGTVTSASR